MTIPNGWHIKYNPKPIPIRGHDWDFWHDEVDNDSRLCGTAGSEEEAKLAIMEKQAERYGFDKHADKPDDFESHINIESLQAENATLKADLAALREVEREKVAAWILSFGFATGHGDTIEDLLSEAGTQIQELRAAQEWVPVSERLPKKGIPVLAHYKNRLGNSRRVRAEYIFPRTVEAGLDDECELDWSDDEEQCWIKSGWYELVNNCDEYNFYNIYEGEVTEWMPLPLPPQPAQENAEDGV